MKIVSYNINGIRAAIKKGFVEWLQQEQFDIICLQEVKASEHEADLSEVVKMGYHISWFAAQKKGYSGVAILTKIKPQNVVLGNGYTQSDSEGRVIQNVFADFILINTYFPSGSSGDERQEYKYQFLNEYTIFLKSILHTQKQVIVVGDFNICHRPIDIHDPISNKNTSGFLPDERAWMDAYFDGLMCDAFRVINPHPHQYTWWSYRANARQNNKGWRIDYTTVSPSLKPLIKDAVILNQIYFSDHCPIVLDIDL